MPNRCVKACRVCTSGARVAWRVCRNWPNSVICAGCSCRNSATTCNGVRSPLLCGTVAVCNWRILSTVSFVTSGVLRSGFCAYIPVQVVNKIVSKTRAIPIFFMAAVSWKRAFCAFHDPDTAACARVHCRLFFSQPLLEKLTPAPSFRGAKRRESLFFLGFFTVKGFRFARDGGQFQVYRRQSGS